MIQILKYITWPSAVGLLLAFIILQQYPHRSAIEHEARGDPRLGPVSYATAVKKAAPSVVNIYTSKIVRQQPHPFFKDRLFNQFFYRSNRSRKERIQRSLGSGVIISSEGYLLTNHHVIENADEILVQLQDNRETLAEIVGSDPDTDLAVLKIDLPDLIAATIGDPQAAQVGDVVLAIGNPFGLEQTVTQGIISATGRHGLNINTYENFIQTDAAINPGNSGGALIDVYGNLIGINSNIIEAQGIGLAIPANIASKVLLDIIRHGRVIRGWLGIEAQQLSPRLAQQFAIKRPISHSLVVTGTYPNGPAHLAGLLPGDLITGINGQSMSNGHAGMQQVANTQPGGKIIIDVLRDGKPVQISVIVGTRPQRS